MKPIHIILCLALFLFTSICSASVGKVLFAVGDVQVERDTRMQLKRGDDIEIGDTLITGEKSRLQILFSDNARVSLRANSELKVDNYIYNQGSAGPSATASVGGESAFSLVKGGFRTITGAITAGQDKSGYKITTAVATIGIRGTDYSVLYCDDDCEPLVTSNDKRIENGLYAGVSQGAIVLLNNAGELQLNASESGFVASIDSMPTRLLGPPRSLFGQTQAVKNLEQIDFALKQQIFEDVEDELVTTQPPVASTDDQQQHNDHEQNDEVAIAKAIVAEDGSIIDIDDGVIDSSDLEPPFEPELDPLVGSFSYDNASLAITGDLESLEFDENGNLIGFSTSDASISLGTALNLNSGFDPDTGFRWGRWSDGSATVNGESVDLTEQNLHWLTNDLFEYDVALVQSGSASYSLIGNTDPTNNFGERGVLGSAQFSANFTNQTVFSSLSIGLGGNNWQASGSGSIANGLTSFYGVYDTVSVNGVNDGSGQFSGFFSPISHSNGTPLGAGLSYALSNASNTEHINGTAIFSQPNVEQP